MNFMFPNSDHKLFRDKLTRNLFCTDIDESCLFMSSDDGLNWNKVADKQSDYHPSAFLYVQDEKLHLILSTSDGRVTERIENDDGTWTEPREIAFPE